MSFRFQSEQWIPMPLEKGFRFFANPGNLARIMPAWMRVELISVKIVAPPGVAAVTATVADGEPFAGAGSELKACYRVLPLLPFRICSVALITEFVMNEYFADVQKQGPFKRWHHRHEFVAESRNGINGTVVRDRVEYEVGFAWLGSLVNQLFIAPQMRRTFAHRQAALEKLLHV